MCVITRSFLRHCPTTSRVTTGIYKIAQFLYAILWRGFVPSANQTVSFVDGKCNWIKYCTNYSPSLIWVTDINAHFLPIQKCFSLSCKANSRVKFAKTGHGPHSSKLVVICVVLCIASVQMCTVIVPPGDNPIADNKYILSYTSLAYIIVFIPCKGKTIPLQTWTGPSGLQELTEFLDSRLKRVVRFSDLRTGSLCPKGDIAGTYFCYAYFTHNDFGRTLKRRTSTFH